MILFFIYFIELLEHKGKAILFFNFMGIISLESYLFNGYVRYVFMDLPIYTSKSILFYGHYIDYFLIFIVGTILSYLINKISTYIFRKVDFIARSGGDEFVCVLSDTSCTEGKRAAQRLYQGLEERNYFITDIEAFLHRKLEILVDTFLFSNMID